MTPDNVFGLVNQFFSSRTNPPGPVCGPATRNLLQIACRGNAEKTIQGELLHFLRLNSICAVSENGYRTAVADRHIDIMVFDGDQPLLAIELKHFSPHQGGVGPLYKSLDEDYCKCKGSASTALPATIPLIQVALFTEIDNIHPLPASVADFAFYRFISAYVLKDKENIKISKKTLADHQKEFGVWYESVGARYSHPGTGSSTLNAGISESFNIPSSTGGGGPYSVTGKVHWFLAMTK